MAGRKLFRTEVSDQAQTRREKPSISGVAIDSDIRLDRLAEGIQKILYLAGLLADGVQRTLFHPLIDVSAKGRRRADAVAALSSQLRH